MGSNTKFTLFEHLDTLQKKNPPDIYTDSQCSNMEFVSPASGHFFEHTRAFLKIQDGCNAFCSYCIVPFTRGRSRSGKPAKLIRQARELVDKGYREIVLTGAHTGCYGKDLTPPGYLVDLMIELEKIDGLDRIRLSSIEPMEITSALIEFIASSSKMCPHLHIPLQSGDSAILQAMNRHYSPDEYRQVVEKVIEKIPDAALGADVLIGFPGETDEQAENTYQFIQSLPLAYLHVFNYSVRKGTAAAKLTDRIPNAIKKLRSQRLRSLANVKKNVFHQRFSGKPLKVLFEQIDSNRQVNGLSENYIRVKAPGNESLINQIVPVKIVQIDTDFVWGQINVTDHNERKRKN